LSARVVVDASAVIAWAFKEEGYADVGALLPSAVITSAQAIEILARSYRNGLPVGEVAVITAVREMGTQIEPVIADDVERAAGLIATAQVRGRSGRVGTISLGDSMCIAVAERLGLPVVTSDRAWLDLDVRVPVHLFRA